MSSASEFINPNDLNTSSTEELNNEEDCYEIIEIEVMPKEDASDNLQNEDFEEFTVSNELKKVAQKERIQTNIKVKDLSKKLCATNCLFKCTEKFSEEAQKNIHAHFWKLSTQQKLNFYENYISINTKNSPGIKRCFQFYLPICDELTQQVCKPYFLCTLDISEQKLTQYLKKHEKEHERSKALIECEIKEIKNHMCNFFTDDKFTASKMYALYKAKSKNPVDVETYKRIFNKIFEKINSTALALETQLELEEEIGFKTSQVEKFGVIDDVSSSSEAATEENSIDFQRIFEAHAFNANVSENEEDRRKKFKNANVENDITNAFFAVNEVDKYDNISLSEDLKCEIPHEDFEFFESDMQDESVECSRSIANASDSTSDHQRSRESKKRQRNPELWKQNVRKYLCQKGLPYVDRLGVKRSGKSVGPACASTCLFACTKDFSNELRRRIHRDFWNLTTQEKRHFISTYVQKLNVKRRSIKCRAQKEPRKKNSFRYFLPNAGDSIRVCKFFFLQTLAISEAKIHYYFETYHNNDAAKTIAVLPGRGRKSSLQLRIQGVREHIRNFTGGNTISTVKMYDIYTAETENPVSVDTYRRIRTQMLRENSLSGSKQQQRFKTKIEVENIHESSIEIANEADDRYFESNSLFTSSVSDAENSTNDTATIDQTLEETSTLYFDHESDEETENAEFNVTREEISPFASFSETYKRPRNPEVWMQNVRIKLRQKGLSYIDRNGNEHAAKKVGPPCASTCTYLCTMHFSKEERERIHKNFWNLTTQEKRNFYGTYVKKVEIRKRSKESRTQVNPKRKRSFQYYLPLADKSIRVCQYYFLKTLSISDAMVHYYFQKYHKEDDDDDEISRRHRGGKGFPLQEVQDHIKSFAATNELSVSKMYELYKAKTKNPVCLDIYRRVKQVILGKSTSDSSKRKISELNSSAPSKESVTKNEKPSTIQPNKDSKSNLMLSNRQTSNEKKRTPRPPCDKSCCHSCTTKISKRERIRIHADFEQLSKNDQLKFYSNYIKNVSVKCKSLSQKQQFFVYKLPVGDQTIRVCRKYFVSTLDVSESSLYYYLNKQRRVN